MINLRMRRRHILKNFWKMFASKFCALSQNVMSIAYLVLKLLQNIVQAARSVNITFPVTEQQYNSAYAFIFSDLTVCLEKWFKGSLY